MTDETQEEQVQEEQAEQAQEAAPLPAVEQPTRNEIIARMREEAYGRELAAAREEVQASIAARQQEYAERIAAGIDPKEALEGLPDTPVMDFGFFQEVTRRANESILGYVFIDTNNDKPVLLSTNLETGEQRFVEIHRWLKLPMLDIDRLRDIENKGECKLIVKPLGWEPLS